MPDGKRTRRHSKNLAKRTWYATHRAFRFARRFGMVLDTAAACTAYRNCCHGVQKSLLPTQ